MHALRDRPFISLHVIVACVYIVDLFDRRKYCCVGWLYNKKLLCKNECGELFWQVKVSQQTSTVWVHFDIVAWQRTCDSQVAGSRPGWTPLCSGLGQATYTCVPLSPSSIIWYRPRGVISLTGKVTAGLVKSDGSLPPGLWRVSPAGWLSIENETKRSYSSSCIWDNYTLL